MYSKKIIAVSYLTTAALYAHGTTNFIIKNGYGSEINVINPSQHQQHYSVPEKQSINLSKVKPAWNGLNNSAKHIPMKITSPNNKPLCADSPFMNHNILNMPKESGTLVVSSNGQCTFKQKGQAGKIIASTIPDIGKVIVGQNYAHKHNPLINIGFYIKSNSPDYNYKDKQHSLHYSAQGLPEGLNIYSWGSAHFNANYNGEIYGTPSSTKGCTAVDGHKGYYKCPVTIKAYEPDIQKGKPITSKFNLYLYTGLTAQSLTNMADYNQAHPNDMIRLNIGVNPSNTQNIADLSKLFRAYNQEALKTLHYTIAKSKSLSPINIVNQQEISPDSLVISKEGKLSVKNLPENSIIQFTVIAKNELGQSAQQTMYVNYSNQNKNGIPFYTPSSSLPKATSAWVYGANSSDSSIQKTYLEKLKNHHVKYMTPDMGWIQLHDAKDIWNMNTKTPIDNNIGTSASGQIQKTAAYYKEGYPDINFIITIEFGSKLKGILPVLTNASVPGKAQNEHGQYTNQLQTLETSIAESVLSTANFDGMQFDIEPLPTQPRALQLYKGLADRLARKGKIFEIYGFANAMTPAMALASGPLTIWIPSMYDVGGYTDPKNYQWDTEELHYDTDTQCHFDANGVKAYYTNSWCNLTVSDTAFQNTVLLSKQKKQPPFSEIIQQYGIHFQLGVPAEGSALNWSQLEIWNPQKDSKGNFPSVITGQKYKVKNYTYKDPKTKENKTVQYYLFDSNKNKETDKPSTQAEYVLSDMKVAIQNNLGTPKTNPLNLGLALYGLSNERKVLGCRPGEKHGGKPNCIVQLPISISEDSPVWKLADDYLQGNIPKNQDN